MAVEAHPPGRARLLEGGQFADALRRAVAAEEGAGFGCLVHLGLHETPQLEQSFGRHANAEIAAQVAELVLACIRASDVVGYDDRLLRLVLLLRNTTSEAVCERLDSLSRQIAAHTFRVGGEPVRVTPLLGVVEFPSGGVEELRLRAEVAVAYADTRLDLLVAPYEALTSAQRKRRRSRLLRRPGLEEFRTPFQVLLALLAPLLLPLAAYVGLGRAGVDFTPFVYLAVVAALVMTALTIWIEGFHALRRIDPPEEPGRPYPPASAIIPAYLPNEDATIVETVEAFLRQDYPAPLQVILAYNTPVPLPVEVDLREIAARDPRFLPLHVELSTSKAQNINAALREVGGDFVGIFDADHHPDPGSFRRAWRWLANGYDVVQGHCVIRNGDASWVARTVAVEFEAIYAVAHPGRARFHRFGIFGGTNGYWRTDLLHRIRMRMFMLTEDIDASIRAVESGARIVSDPYLVSRELGPATLTALWNQRLRWGQGWFQVSLRHLPKVLRSRNLTPRQKMGMAYLLGWSQAYPWISAQVFPILLFWGLTRGFESLDWFVPVFVVTTLFTLGAGPARTLFAYRVGEPAIRRERGWFLRYLLLEPLFYTPLKNLVTRVAHLRQAMGETQWKVTPRDPDSDAAP